MVVLMEENISQSLVDEFLDDSIIESQDFIDEF